jgi:putative endonuclease
MCWVTYMVRCSDGTLYTGVTNDIEKRVKTHNAGKGAKYTRSRLPVTLVYMETHSDRSTAQRAEAGLKGLKRAEKIEMIGDDDAE